MFVLEKNVVFLYTIYRVLPRTVSDSPFAGISIPRTSSIFGGGTLWKIKGKVHKMLETILSLVGIVVTVISIIVTIISILQNGKKDEH